MRSKRANYITSFSLVSIHSHHPFFLIKMQIIHSIISFYLFTLYLCICYFLFLIISPPPKLEMLHFSSNGTSLVKGFWATLTERIILYSRLPVLNIPFAMLIMLYSNSLIPSLSPLLDSSNVCLLWCFLARVKGMGADVREGSGSGKLKRTF